MQSTERSLRPLTIGVVALALLLLVAACGGSSEGEGEEGEEAEAAEVVGSVPASLGATEADAEGIVDVALANDRAGLRDQAAHLKADAEQAAAGPLAEANVPADELRELRGRAANVDELAEGGKALEVALAANAVSGLMPALYAHFDVAVPTAVLELDYLEREAHLRSLAHEDAAAAAAVGRLQRTWRRLRPQVVGSGGQDEAARFAEHLAAMERLRREGDASGLQDEAKNGLELVDELERVFA